MKNYFDMKTRNTTDYVDQVIDKIKKEEASKPDQSSQGVGFYIPLWCGVLQQG
jgi:hypothetical protein